MLRMARDVVLDNRDMLCCGDQRKRERLKKAGEIVFYALFEHALKEQFIPKKTYFHHLVFVRFCVSLFFSVCVWHIKKCDIWIAFLLSYNKIE